MIALSVAKLKMFSPESEIFTVSYPTCPHGIIVHDYIQEVKIKNSLLSILMMIIISIIVVNHCQFAGNYSSLIACIPQKIGFFLKP